MSRTIKDIRYEYLSDKEKINRDNKKRGRCCDYHFPKSNRTERERNAIKLELSANNLTVTTNSLTQLLKEIENENW